MKLASFSSFLTTVMCSTNSCLITTNKIEFSSTFIEDSRYYSSLTTMVVNRPTHLVFWIYLMSNPSFKQITEFHITTVKIRSLT